MSESTLSLSLSSDDQMALFKMIKQRLFSQKPKPDSFTVDYKERKVGKDWFESWVSKGKFSIQAIWGEKQQEWISYNYEDAIKLSIAHNIDIDSLANILEDMPFSVAVFGTTHRNLMRDEYKDIRTGFGDKHFSLGWGCAFKGRGHQHLVSRRWLTFGPWRLKRYRHDLSIVQFYELDVDFETALSQAKPGYHRMGISDAGGYIQTNFVYSHDISGIYLPEERFLKIAVDNRHITPLEMLNAAAVRRYQKLGPDSPLERIAYVFMEEERARHYLHELWLYGLECWAFVKGVQQRLDTNYHPIPTPPEWAIRLGTDAL